MREQMKGNVKSANQVLGPKGEEKRAMKVAESVYERGGE